MDKIDIGLIASVCGLVAYVVAITSNYTKLKTSFENFKETMIERMKVKDENIKELFDSRNETNQTLVKLTTILDSLVNQNKSIESKIDELRKEISAK